MKILPFISRLPFLMPALSFLRMHASDAVATLMRLSAAGSRCMWRPGRVLRGDREEIVMLAGLLRHLELRLLSCWMSRLK